VVEISVVIPVYGCRECLPSLHDRLTAALKELGHSYELVFVDDRSPDASWAVLQDLAAADPKVRALRLSRNFGQHAAITAGLGASRGRYTVVMDCDLQEPPEEIGRLYAKVREGFDLVLARRSHRKHSPARLLAARTYFRLLNFFSGSSLEGDYGTFSILSAKVRDAYLGLGEQDRHYLLILNWLGFEPGVIDVVHGARHAGRSSYTLGRLLSHAIGGMLFQTTNLLVWIIYVGFALSLVGAGLAAYYLYVWRVATPPPGWTTIMVLLLLVGGFIIISTGVTGLYISKVFQQVKGRPLYLVDVVAEAPQGGAAPIAREEARTAG